MDGSMKRTMLQSRVVIVLVLQCDVVSAWKVSNVLCD